MKGLFVKDLLVLRRYIRTMAVFVLVYILVFTLIDSADVISGMVPLVLAMMSMAAFSYDELAKWDRFALTMPVSRRQVVGARYLVSLCFTLLGSAVTLVFSLGLGYLRKTGDPAEQLLTAYVVFAAALGFLSLVLPLLYRFGPERGRLFMIAAFLLPTLLLLLFRDSLAALFSSQEVLEQALLVSLPAALLLLGLSFLVSCRVYQAKEF